MSNITSLCRNVKPIRKTDKVQTEEIWDWNYVSIIKAGNPSESIKENAFYQPLLFEIVGGRNKGRKFPIWFCVDSPDKDLESKIDFTRRVLGRISEAVGVKKIDKIEDLFGKPFWILVQTISGPKNRRYVIQGDVATSILSDYEYYTVPF